MTVRDNVAFGLKIRKRPEGRDRRARSTSCSRRRPRRLRRALPVAALRRPAAAHGAGPRAGRRAAACCCSTSRSARWTPRSAPSCAPGCGGCTTRSTSPPSWSPTTRRRRWRSPTTIAVLNDGRIEQVGAPRELYDAPANAFVMGFLGPVARLGDALVRPHDLTLVARAAAPARRGAWSRASCTSASRSASSSAGDGERGRPCSSRAPRPTRSSCGRATSCTSRRGGAGAGGAASDEDAGPDRRRDAGRSRAQRVTQASGSSASRVDVVRAACRAARSAERHVSRRPRAGSRGPRSRPAAAPRRRPRRRRPRAAAPRTEASGPSTARMTSATEIASARAARASSRRRRRAGCARARRGAGRRGCSPGTSAGCPAPWRSPRPWSPPAVVRARAASSTAARTA